MAAASNGASVASATSASSDLPMQWWKGPPMSGTKILWGQVIVVGLIVLLAIWGATEWTAWRLAYQPELGRPWFELLGFKIYYPPIFFWWWFVFDAYAPEVFVEGAFIAASGTFVSIAVAIGMSGVAALYLGKQEGKDLVYMGKVGTGWSRTTSSEIRKALDTVVSPKQKLTKAVRKPKATWVEPKFFANVEYRDITSEGLLRASSFKGLTRK